MNSWEKEISDFNKSLEENGNLGADNHHIENKEIVKSIIQSNLSLMDNSEDFLKGFGGDLQKRFPNGAWRTINGAKVFINGGKVVAGLDGFNKQIDSFFDKKKQSSGSETKKEQTKHSPLAEKVLTKIKQESISSQKNKLATFKKDIETSKKTLEVLNKQLKDNPGDEATIAGIKKYEQGNANKQFFVDGIEGNLSEKEPTRAERIKARGEELRKKEAEEKKNQPTYAERTKLDESKVHPELLKMKELAMRASSATSFDPEIRGKQILEGYSAELNEDIEIIKKHGGDVGRYTDKYASMMQDWLGAKSRTMSSMITGGSNFPVRRAEKANQAERNKSEAFQAWRKKALKAITKPESTTIVRGESDAISKMKSKLESLETAQATMKGLNKIVKNKKLSDEQKIKQSMEAYPKFSEASIKQLLEPDYGGRVGFPSYSLTNNNAKISKLKKDVAYETERMSKYESGNKEYKIGEVDVVENVEDNRIQLHFDGKPSDEMRNKLKKNGFRWSPKNTAWQRQLTQAAIYSTKNVLG